MTKKKDLKTFYIRTYGCQMNELDTSVMAGTLQKRGLTRTDEEESADLIIYNTCSVRDLAERKVMGKLGILGKTSQRNAVIGVTGCMANAKKETLFRKLPHVDFVLGTNNLHDLNAVLDTVTTTSKPVAFTDNLFTHELDYLGAARREGPIAYVSIIRGCDKFCTYCVVPYTRGKEVSRSPDDILQECRQLADNGIKELLLLGQNVNSYGKDRPEWQCLFSELLYRIDKIPGIERVRFLTSHPVDITRSLMEAVRDLPSLCESVHFPFQAGSNRILKKMHRIYTIEEYVEKVAALQEIVPGVTLGTDVIVGFPTETDAEFQETVDLMEKIKFATAYLYTYSPRKGTPAMRWADDVPQHVKDERLQVLQTLHQENVSRQLQEMVGTTVEVLVARRNQKDDAYLKGQTRCGRSVIFPGDDAMVGTLQQVRLHSYSHATLLGRVHDGHDRERMMER